MPVSCKLRDGKWRVVEPSGKIARTPKGNAVNGGGHDSKEKCQKQARAINRKTEENKMAETYNCECIKCGYKQTSTKHCADLKCPKCGGQMRRVERPGPGQDKNSASINACIFAEPSEISFAAAEGEKDDRFRMIVYSGKIIPNHWLWGNIAFDLTGLKFDKKKTAVLEEHFSANRIGFTTNQEITDKVVVEGKFLSNPKAREMKNDLTDGFPMQASLYVPPALIEHVKEGEDVEVNGQKLKGPGTVFRKATIREVSMCALGADSHTQSKTFADSKREIQFNVLEREQIMDEVTKLELTAETFAAEYPELSEQVTATAKAEGVTEGENAERERFSQIHELAKDDPAFVVEMFEQGKTVDEVKTALIDRLRKQKDEAATTKAKVDPAHQEFSDEQKPDKDKDGKPATWDAALKQQMTETKCSEADAVRFVVRTYPELHQKMLEEQGKK